MKLWLDDVRRPEQWGHLGWRWCKTADEAIDLLKTGQVTKASLDHDLAFEHQPQNGIIPAQWQEKTGMAVCEFLEQNPQYYPDGGVVVHSANIPARDRMQMVLERIKKGGKR